jgi:hypothetical protein
MTEKIILKETITKGKPEVESKPKKKYYKPRKKREIIEVDIKDLDPVSYTHLTLPTSP